MKPIIQINGNNIKKVNNNLLNRIKSKNKSSEIFHNKLLNNIIELNKFDNDFSLSNYNRQKEKDIKNNFNYTIRKMNSAIMRNNQSQINNNNNEYSNMHIKYNNLFVKKKNNSNFLGDIYKKQNKTINEENKLIKFDISTKYNFPNNINSIKKNNTRIFYRNNLKIKEDEKCNKMAKYVNILEKKMKEKLMQITNFEDINCCYQTIKIKNSKNNKTNKNNGNKNILFLDINNIYKLNNIEKSNDNIPKNNISTFKNNNLYINSKNNSKPKHLSTNKENAMPNLDKFIQYIKEEVKNHFIKNNFESIKDYFNDWLFYGRLNNNKNKLYLDLEDIYYYLKEKLELKISKEQISKMFNNNSVYFDIDNFKNFFFEENSGKEFFIITKDFLLKKSKLDFDSKINKPNYILSPITPNNLRENIIDNNYKIDLLFNTLKEQKSKILDIICDYNSENKDKIEYEYNDFYNLINSLKIDKNIFEPKIIKAIFLKYQNKNKKLNIKYFINILYGNNNITKECLLEDKEPKVINKIKAINKNDNIIYNNKKLKNHSVINPKINENNINKRNKIKLNRNNTINNNLNKNTDGSSDYMDIVVKPKEQYFKNKIKKYEKFKKKSITPSFKQNILVNQSVSSSHHMDILDKISESKRIKKYRKKSFGFFDKIIIENSKNSLIGEDLNSNDKEKRLVKNIKKNKTKSKRKKLFKYNNFKTIKIRKKYNLNKENQTSKNDNNKEKHYKVKMRLSAYIKSKRKYNKIKKISSIKKYEIPKIFEESRIQYLNSDIIDLI